MKKRLLALALCFVMAVSLLPITALADDHDPIISGLEYGKTYCGAVQFSVSVASGGTLRVSYQTSPSEPSVPITTDGAGNYTLPAGIGQVSVEASNTIILNDNYPHSFFTGLRVTVNKGHTWGVGTPVGNGKHTHSCTVAGCGASETVSCSDTDGDHLCDNCGASVHTWQFTQTENSLTATCESCNIDPMSVTLKANSVTLPDSPFNARVILNGITEEQIKDEFGYEISPIRYKFKTPGESTFTDITPADGAREGTYQAAVTLSPIPSDGRRARSTANQGLNIAADGSVTLYTQYTAANPEVTAQTGDNRPIELMLVSVLVFSALAAAAFVLDNKRKYSR